MQQSFTTKIQKTLGDRLEKLESASLRLNKYVDLKNKKTEIEAVIALHKNKSERIPNFTPQNSHIFFAKLGANMIVNHVGGILENAGICLHRHFNDPYIPGSAVKGIARHAAWCEWFSADEPQKAEIAQNIADVFGFPTGDKDGLDAYLNKLKFKEQSGKIAFLAAVPVEKPNLVLDIVNCHHMKYYGSESQNSQALDNESTNPQFFPAVQAGAIFRFTMVPLKPGALVDQAAKWLRAAIENHGAGAKTSAGYGWFYEDLEYTKLLQKRDDVKKQQEEERKAEELRKKIVEEERLQLLEEEKKKMLLSPQARIEAEINQLPEEAFIRQMQYPIAAEKIGAFCNRLKNDTLLWEKVKKSLLSAKKQAQIRDIRSKAKAIGVELS